MITTSINSSSMLAPEFSATLAPASVSSLPFRVINSNEQIVKINGRYEHLSFMLPRDAVSNINFLYMVARYLTVFGRQNMTLVAATHVWRNPFSHVSSRFSHTNLWMLHKPRQRRSLSTKGPDSRFKFLYLGRDEFSCVVLKALYDAPDVWDNISIATNPDERLGRKLSISPLKRLAESLQLPVYTIPSIKSEFKTWRPPPPFSHSESPPLNHVVLTASFGRILPPTLLNMFAPTRRLNVHPSLLPAHRGPAPIQHAILNGDKETGVCVIEMLRWKDGIDAGPIWGSSRVPVPDGAMFVELRDSLAHAGGKLLVSVLREMQAGKASATPQSPVGSLTHAHTISLNDSVVDFKTMSAELIVQRYRAISHQRPLTTVLTTGKTVQLHSPSVYNGSATFSPRNPGSATYDKKAHSLLVLCAGGSLLSVPSIKQEGKILMGAKDWWNGARGVNLVTDGQVNFTNESIEG